MTKRKDKRKSKSPTVKPVAQVKPEPAEAKPPVNLCDECAYEFGACEGVPKFASAADPSLKGAEADRVIKCKGFINVKAMPTSDQVNKEPEEHVAERAEAAVEAAPEAERQDAIKARAIVPAQGPANRFQREEDLGKCPSCDRPLKRTAFNRNRDAVRCVNPRCRQYRSVIRNIRAK